MPDNHPITVAKYQGSVVVRWRGREIVRTENAVELREASYPPVIYVPRADADMSVFQRSQHTTVCPYKGTANYFSLSAGDANDADAVWTYEDPKPVAAGIRERLAFYPDKVEIVRGKV